MVKLGGKYFRFVLYIQVCVLIGERSGLDIWLIQSKHMLSKPCWHCDIVRVTMSQWLLYVKDNIYLVRSKWAVVAIHFWFYHRKQFMVFTSVNQGRHLCRGFSSYKPRAQNTACLSSHSENGVNKFFTAEWKERPSGIHIYSLSEAQPRGVKEEDAG